MPSKLREIFEENYIENFVITKWYDNCLCVYPQNEWKNLEKKLNSLPKTDPNTRYVLRTLFANAAETKIDRQGRIFIPPSLRQQLGIVKDVVIVGVSNLIEIWNKEKWEEYHKKVQKPFEEIAQQLGV